MFILISRRDCNLLELTNLILQAKKIRYNDFIANNPHAHSPQPAQPNAKPRVKFDFALVYPNKQGAAVLKQFATSYIINESNQITSDTDIELTLQEAQLEIGDFIDATVSVDYS
jgi:hypothetical protein